MYHIPGHAYYSATRISLAHGERWFCSEVEAQAVRWRKSKV
ncbi:sunset domain-containing protein [Rhizobium sp. 2YAF20]